MNLTTRFSLEYGLVFCFSSLYVFNKNSNLLSEKPTIRYPNAETRLVIILLFEETFGVLGLDDDLVGGIVVQAEGHHVTVGPLVIGEGQGRGDIAVVVVVTAKDIELLVINRFDGTEDVVGCFTTVCDCFLSHLGTWIR